MLAFPNVVHLFFDEFTGLRARRLPFPSIFAGSFDGSFFWHQFPFVNCVARLLLFPRRCAARIFGHNPQLCSDILRQSQVFLECRKGLGGELPHVGVFCTL